MKYWLVKSEPGAYPWSTFVADGRTYWDGVRNYQARNNMAAMKEGDEVLFYHSVSDKAVVGTARVCRESYQDPTTDDERWLVVDLEPTQALARPVSLAEIKAEASLQEIALVRQSRLSVVPLTAAEFRKIVKMASKPAKAPAKAKAITAKPAQTKAAKAKATKSKPKKAAAKS